MKSSRLRKISREAKPAAVGMRILAITLPIAAAASALAPDPASSADPFYKGKKIKVIIRSGPGGGNDVYGRLMGRHIIRHIPGNLAMVPVNMSGGGGIVASNYMHNRAKRNGTEIAILGRDVANSQRLKATGVKYDVRNLIPLGSMTSSVWTWIIRGSHPVKTLRDLKTFKGTVKFSATGAGSGSVQKVRLLANEGMPVVSITGYDGNDEKILAILRGDVDATSSVWSSMRPYVEAEKLRVIGRIGKHPELMHVPDVRELLSEDGKALANLMAAPQEAGRPFFTAPKVPRDRVAILRAAFKKACGDPKLLAEAKRARKSIGWSSGEDLEKLYVEILNSSDKVIDAFKKL